MEKKIFLVEDWDCNYNAFEDFEDAIRYAVNQILISPDNEEIRFDMFTELITSAIEHNKKGFVIDEFMWCWEIDYFEGAVTV